MEIIISKNKKIISDNLNWIYYVRMKNKNSNTYTWKFKWFYPNLKSCYFDLLDHFTRNSEKDKLKDAFEESVNKLENIKKEILK